MVFFYAKSIPLSLYSLFLVCRVYFYFPRRTCVCVQGKLHVFSLWSMWRRHLNPCACSSPGVINARPLFHFIRGIRGIHQSIIIIIIRRDHRVSNSKSQNSRLNFHRRWKRICRADPGSPDLATLHKPSAWPESFV